jgi:phthiocerol/phenolphthiocerol synthesis type-I polyketide synthase E
MSYAKNKLHLEEPEVLLRMPSQPPASADAITSQLLILSAETEPALEQATQSLQEFLVCNDSVNMSDVAYTLQTGRTMLAHKRTLVCNDRQDAITALAERSPRRVLSHQPDEPRRPLVFLLPGVGDQYVGMAHDLYVTWDLFRQEVDRCAEILAPYLGTDIRNILYPSGQTWKKDTQPKGIDLKQMLGRNTGEPKDPDTASLNRTLFAQPALFTIEYAMARLWQRLGATPDAIVGHSMGEYVAACLAGVFPLHDALRLIVTRARLVSELPQAVMLSVMLSEGELRPLLREDLCISLINGPSHCVVAGPSEAVAGLETLLSEREVISCRVQNGHAFHSRMMDPIVDSFESEVSKVQLREPRIPYISNVTGNWVTAGQATDPAYWAQHLNHTARFSDALHQMWQLANPLLLECGPGHTLGMLAAQHPDRKGTIREGSIWSIRQRYQNEADDKVLLNAIAKVWLSGRAVDWENIQSRGRGHRITLPTNPFDPQYPRPNTATEDSTTSREESTAEGNRAQSESTVSRARQVARDASAPISAVEATLLRMWEDVLETRGFGVDDSFFNLGGTSLHSVKLLAEIKRRFRMDLRLTAILEAPTVRSMAVLISQSADHERSGLICLKGDGEVNLFLVHDGFGETLLYLHLAKRLPARISVYGIEPKRLTGIPLAHTSVEEMAAFYIDQIRKVQPHGPYLLGGLCAGGVIAYAMAACLKERGEQVQIVALLDSAMPQAAKRSRRALGNRLSRLEDAAKQAYRAGVARRARWISVASVIGRKVRNAATYEFSYLFERISVRLRFAFLKVAIRHNFRWPTAMPTLSVLQIYTVLRSRYMPPVLADVPVLLVRASSGEGADTPYRELYRDEDLGWRGVANRLELADANGGHSTMVQEHLVDSVASVMIERLSAILPPKDRSR